MTDNQPKEIIKPKQVEENPTSLKGEMAEIREQLSILVETPRVKEKNKRFKMPTGLKSKTKNLKKMMDKNKVQVMLLKSTGAIQPTIGEISSGRLIVGDQYWNAADDIIWNWGGKTPTAIICDWDMQPLTKKRLMEETDSLKTWLHPQTIIIRAIEAKQALEATGKSKMSIGLIIGIIVALIVGYYLFVGGVN